MRTIRRIIWQCLELPSLGSLIVGRRRESNCIDTRCSLEVGSVKGAPWTVEPTLLANLQKFSIAVLELVELVVVLLVHDYFLGHCVGVMCCAVQFLIHSDAIQVILQLHLPVWTDEGCIGCRVLWAIDKRVRIQTILSVHLTLRKHKRLCPQALPETAICNCRFLLYNGCVIAGRVNLLVSFESDTSGSWSPPPILLGEEVRALLAVKVICRQHHIVIFVALDVVYALWSQHGLSCFAFANIVPRHDHCSSRILLMVEDCTVEVTCSVRSHSSINSHHYIAV